MGEGADIRARAKEVFAQVAEAPGAERAARVAELCAHDAALRREVESLLGAAERAGAFLARPEGPRAPGDAPAAAPGAAFPPSPPEEAGSRVGPYRLLQLIGEGGFGAVYMAEQEHPVRRRVALKIIKLGMDTRQVIARFEAERQALAMMDHPNIARVLDAGATESGRPYFVMELVRGVPITDYCDSAHLSTRQRLELFIHVCHAVQHAHQKGIIHRDLKPGNVLVTLHDSVPVPKVIDFGIAKATAGRLTDKTLFTEFRQFIGTPEYMSPEQADLSGLDVDTRSDAYSLGVLLYELLTGTTPFDARQLRSAAFGEVQRIIREERPHKPSTRLSTLARAGTRRAGPAPSGAGSLDQVAQRRGCDPATLLRQVRGDLDWIVMKCLEKDRTRRYATVNALAMDLRRCLDGQPVEAGPPSALYRGRKLVWRHRVAFAAGGAVAAAVLLGLALSLYGFVTASRERDAKVKALAAEAAQHAEAEAARAAEAAERARADAQAAEAQRLAYRASIAAADAALQVGDTALARRSLDEAPAPLRGWEWGHLHWLSDRSDRTLHLGVRGARAWTMSPDGRRVFVGDSTRLHVFDAAAGEPAASAAVNLAASFRLAMSPDGTRLLADGYYGLSLLDVPAMRVVREERGAHAGPGPFDRTGALHLVRPPRTGELVLRDSATGADARSLRTAAPPTGASLSPDATRIACNASADRFVVLDARTGAPLWEAAGVNPRFSPAGDRVVAARADSGGRSVLVVHDAAGGEPRAWIDMGQAGPRSASTPDGGWAMSADGARLAVQAGGGQVMLHGGDTFERLTTLQGLESGIGPLFSPDAQRVYAMSWEGTLKAWNAATSPSPLLVPAAQGPHGHAAVSPDGRYVATAEWGRVTLWDATIGAPAWSSCPSLEGPGPLAFSPDGRRLAAGTEHGRVRVLSVAAGQVLAAPADEARPLSRAQRTRVRSLAWTPRGDRLVAGMDGGEVRVLDPDTLAVLAAAGAHAHPVESVGVAPDGSFVLTASAPRAEGVPETILWPAPPASPGGAWEPLRRLEGAGAPAALHPAGDRFAATGPDGLAVYSTGTGQRLTPCPGPRSLATLRFSGDGSRLVAGSRVGVLSVLASDSGDTLLVLRAPSNAPITAAALPDPAGPLVAASADFALVLFECGPPGPGVYEQRERARLAWRLVRRLFGEHTLAAEVERALREDPAHEPLRATALELAAAIGDDAAGFNSAAWGTALSPASTPEEAAWAARLAEAAVRRVPPAHVHGPLNTLGLARYRAGDFEGARATLTQSDAAYRALTGGSHPIDLAALAMACARLGRAEEASTHLRAARDLAASAFADDADTRTLVNEAETVIGSGG